MRHSRIAKSGRHKKFKAINNPNEDEFTLNEIKIKNLSEQKIPKKWTQIIELKNQLKQKQKKKKKKNKTDLICVRTESEPIEKGMTRSDKQLPEVIEQGLYESEYHFMSRLSKLSAKARAEATIEDRFDVDFTKKLDTNSDTNNEKSEIKRKKNKSLKQKLKRIKKREKKGLNKSKDDSFQHLKDPIRFGDRVNEPPLLEAFKNKKLKK